MSDSPTSRPSNSTVRLPPAAGAGDWVLLEEPVPSEGSESGDQAEVIGCMLAYVRSTNGRTRVVMTEGGNRNCALVFNFGCEEEKEEFLRLLQSSPLTRRDDSEILTPDPATISAARPISEVFSAGIVFRIRGLADLAMGWLSGHKRVM